MRYAWAPNEYEIACWDVEQSSDGPVSAASQIML